MTDEQVKALADKAHHEMDTEFEKASVAMKRAVEVLQRFEADLLEATSEGVIPEGMDAKGALAEALHYALRKVATWPTGPAAAVAIAKTFDDFEIERVASDGKTHPPRRRVIRAGLTHHIDECDRKTAYLAEQASGMKGVGDLNTDQTGYGCSFRSSLRARDVFVHARDLL